MKRPAAAGAAPQHGEDCQTMGIHGWIALALTAVGVTALNVGLMHLARRRWRQFGDDAGDDETPDQPGDDAPPR